MVDVWEPLFKHGQHNQLDHGNWARVYHGTRAENVESIRETGLRPPTGVNPYAWYMVTTDRDQAERYSPEGVVIEYQIPPEEVGNFLGPGVEHNVYDFKATAHGVHTPLPGKFISAVHQRKVAKHLGPGNHPSGSSQQAHAGGGGRSSVTVHDGSPLTPDEFTATITASGAFPNLVHAIAKPGLSSVTVDPQALGGIAKGLTRIAADFPKAAEDVIMVKVGDRYNATDHIGEVKSSGTRNPAGDIVHGQAILFNAEKMTPAGLEFDQLRAASDYRPTSLSVESLSHFGESVAIHEFGHVVHNVALQEVTGESAIIQDAENPSTTFMNHDFYVETFGGAAEQWNGPLASNYPDTKAESWSTAIDRAIYGTNDQMEAFHNGVPGPPEPGMTRYGNSNRAEFVAESFSIRHGPEDTFGTVPGMLDTTLDEIEAAAR